MKIGTRALAVAALGLALRGPLEPLSAAVVRDRLVECRRVLVRVRGQGVQDQFGWSSSPVADLTGDGLPELLVGAPFHDGVASNSGRVYLYDGVLGRRLQVHDGTASGQSLGFCVRDAGDVDGDGVSDLLAGGPGGAFSAGVARIWSGATGVELRAVTGNTNELFGYAVAGLGDLDGDGLADFAVGAPGAGRVAVYSGAPGSPFLQQLLGETGGDGFGSALGRVADLTGDGIDELLVGATDGGPLRQGKAYVIDLAANKIVHTFVPDSTGVEFGDQWAADVGDVNADGTTDVFVGDDAADSNRGAAYVFDGRTGALIRKHSGRPGETFGSGRGAGDVDGDGHADLILGGMMNSVGETNAGQASVFSGRDGRRLVTITGTTLAGYLGFDAHGLGDMDGDGNLDYVVTATGNNSRRGEVYVIAGGNEIESVGSGLAGSGGQLPILGITGCSELGSTLDFSVRDVLGATDGYLVLGTTDQATPLRGGVLYTDMAHTAHHVLGGTPGVPGAGTLDFSWWIPNDPALAGVRFVLQAVYLDPGAPQGVSFTNGVRCLLFRSR